MYKCTSAGLLSSILIVTQLAACSSGGGNKEAAPQTSNGIPAAKKDPVQLVFYQTSSGWDEPRFMENYGNKIKEKFPHVTIKFIPSGKLGDLVTAGETIDLLFCSIGHTPGNLLQYELQYDISPLIKQYNVDLNRFEPTSIELQKQMANGGIYGLPVSTSSASLFYNKDIFDKFAIPYPKEGITWDDTFELAKKLTRSDGGQQYRGFAMSFGHIASVNQLSFSYIDPKTNKALFESDKFKVFFDNFKRFYEIPGNDINKDYDSATKQDAMFRKTRQAAMLAHLSGVGTDMPADMNWDMVSLPSFKEAPGIGPQTYPTYFYVTKTGKYKEQSFEVANYLSSDEFQIWQSKRAQVSPLKNPEVHKVFAQDFEGLKGKNVKAMIPQKYADPMIRTKDYGTAETLLGKKFNEAVQQKIDTNTILRQSADELNKQLDTLK